MKFSSEDQTSKVPYSFRISHIGKKKEKKKKTSLKYKNTFLKSNVPMVRSLRSHTDLWGDSVKKENKGKKWLEINHVQNISHLNRS